MIVEWHTLGSRILSVVGFALLVGCTLIFMNGIRLLFWAVFGW
jgi:hypothetical protein